MTFVLCQLVVQPPLISGATFITVLRLLWVMCAACPQLALALHQRSIADTLLCLLTGSTLHQEVSPCPSTLPRDRVSQNMLAEERPIFTSGLVKDVDVHILDTLSNNESKYIINNWN